MQYANVKLYLSDEAYNKGDMEYIAFRNVEIRIRRIGGSTYDAVMSFENTFDDNTLSCVENVSSPPLDESFLVNEPACKLVAGEYVGYHRVTTGNNSEVVFRQCGYYRYLFAVTF